MDLTDLKEKLKYPKSIWFIILNELGERLNYYGLRTVLVLYLTLILKYNGDESTIVYHSFVFMAYLMPLFGAIIADSYSGKFKTIVILSMVYAVGNVVLTGSSMADMFSLNIQRCIAILGLFLISIGMGGIKPCIFPFGGDQFKLPEQEKQLTQFTTKFVIAITVGSLVSSFLTPELRQNVSCFGKTSCFPLAFGVPTVFMFISIGIFVAGKNMYVMIRPKQNSIFRTLGCILYALRSKMTSWSEPTEAHWLDRAKESFTEIEISDTKSVLNMIAVFITFPVFWALYEQQSSRWILQATLMNGRIDYFDWTIKPDQMMALGPFLGVMFIIIFEFALYPLLTIIGIKKPLQKITLSGLLAVIGFIFAAQIQFRIFGNSTVIPSGKGSLNIYNGFECDVVINSSSLHTSTIGPLEMINLNYEPVTRESIIKMSLRFNDKCAFNISENFEFHTTVTFVEGKLISYYLSSSYPNIISLNRVGNYDHLVKDKFGDPKVRTLLDDKIDIINNITLNSSLKQSSTFYSLSSFRRTNFNAVKMGKYNILFNGQLLATSIDLIPATFYTLTVQRNNNKTNVKLFSIDEGNYIHIFWQLPQYVFMIAADVIFVITTMEFVVTEAPINLRSFISALNLLTTSLGNLLVVFVSSIGIKNQAHEYLLYSGIMCVNTLIMAYFSVVYK